MRSLLIGIMVVLINAVSYAAIPDINGFVETAGGIRLSGNDHGVRHQDYTLFETRLQLKKRHFFDQGYLGEHGGMMDVKLEGLLDGYFGWKTNVTARELNFGISPIPQMDLKLGRQVLTWGTGDYLFVNDMFPKDYISFFAGRDDEYLKKPSDAVRSLFYFDAVNVDLVFIPFAEQNTTPEGDRLSFYDSFQGGLAGEDSDRHLIEPPHQLSNSEVALRLFRSLGSYETAAYFFHGFWKNPNSYKDEINRQLFYPRVNVYGASIRGPWMGGIANAEAGYYHSQEDSDGNNRLIANSMAKIMTGYSKDLGSDLQVGVQYLVERTLDYDAYASSLLSQDLSFDEYRHLITQRVTKLFRNQTVECSLFNFYSPSDQDGYLRASISYDWADQWNVTTGINIPWGDDEYTEFGQMQDNKNAYVRVRYSF
ncbi:MAG: hypothetical protein AB1650_07295 [Candidatus Omnitrophota bacterium]